MHASSAKDCLEVRNTSSPAANPTVPHLDILDGGVFSEPVRQSRRPVARYSIEADIQVGEHAVFGKGSSKAEGSLVAYSVSGEAQPTQPLSVLFCRVLELLNSCHARLDSASRKQDRSILLRGGLDHEHSVKGIVQ